MLNTRVTVYSWVEIRTQARQLKDVCAFVLAILPAARLESTPHRSGMGDLPGVIAFGTSGKGISAQEAVWLIIHVLYLHPQSLSSVFICFQ